MPTTFVSTTFVVIVGLNSYGALAPVDKAQLPPGTPGTILWSVDQCNMIRGKMEHAEKYTCQIFRSAQSTAWTYTPPGASEAAPPSQESLQPDINPEHRSGVEDNPAATYVLLYMPSDYRWVSEGGGVSLAECRTMLKERERRFRGAHCVPTP